MLTEKDFRTIRCQAVLFTPEMQFRAVKVFAFLLTEYGDLFDGDPVSLPGMEGLPREMPQLILKSADGKRTLTAGPSRLDLVLNEDPIPDSALNDFLRWATQLGLTYLQKNQAKAGRVACIVQKVAPDPNPPMTLSRHFCQQRWLDKPLDRPGDFQLHAQKRFRLDDLFEINSWVRIQAAVLAKAGQPAGTVPNTVLVEQDFNSLAEQTETRELNPDEIRRFFELAPHEMRHVLDLYFPAKD